MEGVGSWSGGQQKGVQRGERPRYSPPNRTRRTRAVPMDPIPGPSGLPLLAGIPLIGKTSCHNLRPRHRGRCDTWAGSRCLGTMLHGAPLPATFCLSFPKFSKFCLKGICICEWECVPLSGDLSGRLYINTPGLNPGAGIGRAGDAQWGAGSGEWGRGAEEGE